MSRGDAFPPEMRRLFDRFDADPLTLDEGTAERLVAGSLQPADAPPGYAVVAKVLRAAGSPPDSSELVGEAEVVRLLAASVHPTPLTPSVPRRSAVLQKCRSAKVATAVFAAGLGLTSALATAGALPGPAQSITSTVLDKVGVSVPNPSDHTSVIVPADGTTTSSTSTTVTTAPASGSAPTAPVNLPSSGTGSSTPATNPAPGSSVSPPTTIASPGTGSSNPVTSPGPASGAAPTTATPAVGSNQADDGDANEVDNHDANEVDNHDAGQNDDGQAHHGNDGHFGHDDNPNAAVTLPTTATTGPGGQANQASRGQSGEQGNGQSDHQDDHGGEQASQHSDN